MVLRAVFSHLVAFTTTERACHLAVCTGCPKTKLKTPSLGQLRRWVRSECHDVTLHRALNWSGPPFSFVLWRVFFSDLHGASSVRRWMRAKCLCMVQSLGLSNLCREPRPRRIKRSNVAPASAPMNLRPYVAASALVEVFHAYIRHRLFTKIKRPSPRTHCTSGSVLCHVYSRSQDEVGCRMILESMTQAV